MTKTLFEQICDKDELIAAWRGIKKNKYSKGIDKQTIANFKSSADEYIEAIHSELLSSSGYKFSNLRGVAIDKGNGKKRPIRIATVKDRVVQKAICNVIAQPLEDVYKIRNDASFAYLKDRGLLDAVSNIQKAIKDGYKICYKGDIERYFDTVDLDKLLNEMVYPVIGEDKQTKKLIHAALTQEIGNMKELRKKLGGKEASEIFPDIQAGIPQGGILSPLFANVYLHDFDKALLDAGYKVVRYADDFIVLCKTKEDAIKAEKIAQAEVSKLNLKLHPLGTKSEICSTRKFEFLGVKFHKGNLYPSDKAFDRTTDKIRAFADKEKNGGKTLGARLDGLDRLAHSWGSTYWFTRQGGSPKIVNSYSNMHAELFAAVEKILAEHGLVFKNDKKPISKSFKLLGMHKFNAMVQQVHDKNISDPTKEKLARLFYDKDEYEAKKTSLAKRK